ncbi:type II/IV secretion system protein [Candidatus Uhrbacteria bacterium]|nr:type II/IV secretion system protein [Candidatus Uhrbacteria bacterium]
MASDIPSIDDLLTSKGAGPSGSTQQVAVSKLKEKMGTIHLKEKEEETAKAAAAAGLPYVNLKGFPISPDAITQIPKAQAMELNIVCFLNTGSDVRLGTTNASNPQAKELLFQIQERLEAKGGLYLISEASLKEAIAFYDRLPKIRQIIKGVKITSDELNKFSVSSKTPEQIRESLEKANVTDIVTILIAAALELNSSDIHVEAEQSGIVVRLRIDGILQEIATLPLEQWKKIVSRIKLFSGLKINITDTPQDGRFTIFLQSGDTDVRVSCIPTTWGESVVMRVLKASAIQVEFNELGFRPPAEKRLRGEINKPFGMILSTGPTGSGKTTTLYTILRLKAQPDIKVITLEDPIEYKLEGINQSQIDRTKEYTFVTGLRAILRQDPDVLMVGEIRDLETAEVAINASLTGHLLLSTLHTNDAAGALPRLLSMGVKPFLLAPALNAIMGQRLLRRVCTKCGVPATPTPETTAAIRDALASLPTNSGETVPPEAQWKVVAPKGCEACHNTGYKGRVGLFEVLLMDKQIEQAMNDNLSEVKMKELAAAQGMVTLRQDGMLKVLDGITTIEEVMRVTAQEK